MCVESSTIYLPYCGITLMAVLYLLTLPAPLELINNKKLFCYFPNGAKSKTFDNFFISTKKSFTLYVL